jgi:hypothetical protein
MCVFHIITWYKIYETCYWEKNKKAVTIDEFFLFFLNFSIICWNIYLENTFRTYSTFYPCSCPQAIMHENMLYCFFFCVALSHETTKFKECVQTVSCRQPLSQPRNQPCKKEQRTNWNFHFFLRFLFVQKPRNPRHVSRVHFFSHILWILKSHAGRRNFQISKPEPVFLNVYGATESISRNEFRQPM